MQSIKFDKKNKFNPSLHEQALGIFESDQPLNWSKVFKTVLNKDTQSINRHKRRRFQTNRDRRDPNNFDTLNISIGELGHGSLDYSFGSRSGSIHSHRSRKSRKSRRSKMHENFTNHKISSHNCINLHPKPTMVNSKPKRLNSFKPSIKNLHISRLKPRDRKATVNFDNGLRVLHEQADEIQKSLAISSDNLKKLTKKLKSRNNHRKVTNVTFQLNKSGKKIWRIEPPEKKKRNSITNKFSNSVLSSYKNGHTKRVDHENNGDRKLGYHNKNPLLLNMNTTKSVDPHCYLNYLHIHPLKSSKGDNDSLKALQSKQPMKLSCEKKVGARYHSFNHSMSVGKQSNSSESVSFFQEEVKIDESQELEVSQKELKPQTSLPRKRLLSQNVSAGYVESQFKQAETKRDTQTIPKYLLQMDKIMRKLILQKCDFVREKLNTRRASPRARFINPYSTFQKTLRKPKKLEMIYSYLENYEILQAYKITKTVRARTKKVSKILKYIAYLKKLIKARNDLKKQTEIFKEISRLEIGIMIPKRINLSSYPKSIDNKLAKLSPSNVAIPGNVPKIMLKRNSLEARIRKKKNSWIKESLQRQKQIYKQIKVPRYAMHHNSFAF
ncbi:unnamed protein product [Moneuplotes crassus]|uniref:Uncharacterized protein n=1 Tax=Euplotes crassus TaxID=5936 RepID=A0AAD2D5U6_EUPCR|nr:unnamed protein product [Moneuplotes crassus]